MASDNTNDTFCSLGRGREFTDYLLKQAVLEHDIQISNTQACVLCDGAKDGPVEPNPSFCGYHGMHVAMIVVLGDGWKLYHASTYHRRCACEGFAYFKNKNTGEYICLHCASDRVEKAERERSQHLESANKR